MIRKYKNAIVGLVFAGFGGSVLWKVLHLLLAADRGLDLTDEGLYLLAADPPSNTASWGFPFGWHTSPLFKLVGYEISSFRTLGAWILMICSGFTGWHATLLLLELRGKTLYLNRNLVATLGVTVSALGALYYYGGFLRTPSYNWVNIVGIAIAAASQCALIRYLLDATLKRPLVKLVFLMAVASFGLFYSIPAKPSTVVFHSLVFLVFATVVLGRFRALWSVIIQSAGVGLWVVLALLFRLWPQNFFEVFAHAASAPTPSPKQTPFGAVLFVFYSPVYVFEPILQPLGIFNRISGMIASAIAAVILIGAGYVLRRKRFDAGMSRNLRTGLIVLAAAVTLLYLRIPLPGFQFETRSRFIFTPVVSLALILTAVAVLLLLQTTEISVRLPSIRNVGSLVLFLAALPFVSGFGSGHGTFAQASLAVGMLFLVCFLLLVVLADEESRSWPIFVVPLIVGVGLIPAMVDSFRAPYRTAPISQQNILTPVGQRGAHLMLEPSLSEVFTKLDAFLVESNVGGEAIVGLDWRWSSTLPYHLGFRVPESLMLTLSADPSIARHNLRNPLSRELLGKALVSTTPKDRLDPEELRLVVELMEVINSIGPNSFPNDYMCIFDDGMMEIWQVRSSNHPPNQDCPERTNAPPIYDLDGGYAPSR